MAGGHGDIRSRSLFVANIIFDSITVLFTYRSLRRATAKPSYIKLSVAVCSSLVVAAVCGVISIWLPLSLWDGVLRLLVLGPVPLRSALSHIVGYSDPMAVSLGLGRFGPYFWVANTTFLPLLTFAGFVALSMTAKSLIHVAERLCHHAQHPDINPLNMLARFCGLVAAIFATAAFLTKR